MIIAAGERWSADDSLRPALEDHLGAGAILSALVEMGYAEVMSPEARTAADVFDACRGAVSERLRGCVGGRELTERGFAADVQVASEFDVSFAVPVLVDGAFRIAR